MTSSAKYGIELLHDPSLNKSTAFTEAEKQALRLVGLVPDVTETQELQLQRVMMQLGQKHTDLDRYIYLNNLLDHNETLLYRTVMSDPARFLPTAVNVASSTAWPSQCSWARKISRGPVKAAAGAHPSPSMRHLPRKENAATGRASGRCASP
jgi:hypothetical protein